MKQVARFRSRAHIMQMNGSAQPAWAFRYRCEGLLSDVWQSWNRFVRDAIIFSCQGCVTRSGLVVNARPGKDNSTQRLLYEAKQAASKQPVKPSRIITASHLEPTWGNQDKIVDIVIALSPNNVAHLVSAFGVSGTRIKHIQVVRNACAHKNSETVQQVKALSRSYRGGVVEQPVELLWRETRDPIATRTEALYAWLSDIEALVGLATN